MRSSTSSSQEQEDKEGQLEHERLLNFWNKMNIVSHRPTERNLEKVKRRLKERKKDYSIEEIVQAIRNYAKVVNGRTFWEYKWTLWEFLMRKNADKFFPDEFIPENFFGEKKKVDKAKKLLEENPFEEK